MRVYVVALLAMAAVGCGQTSDSFDDAPEDRRYQGRYAAAVTRCVERLAGLRGNERNTREEFFRLFDPSQAVVEEMGSWTADDGVWPHVQVSMPRVANGYYEGVYTGTSIGDDATCYLFNRRSVWNPSY